MSEPEDPPPTPRKDPSPQVPPGKGEPHPLDSAGNDDRTRPLNRPQSQPGKPPPYQPPPPYQSPPPPYATQPPYGRPGQPPGMMAPPPGYAPMPPRPKKSKFASRAIKIGTVGVLGSLVVAFCAAQNDYDEVNADCVDTTQRQPDGSYVVLEDDYCENPTRHYSGTHGAFIWYYAGTRVGNYVRAGTTVRPPQGTQINTRSGKVIQRGGFGSHGSSGS